MELKTLVIDRQKWGRGLLQGEYTDSDLKILADSALLNKANKMCCLGFYCASLGFTPEQMKGRIDPTSLIIYTAIINVKDYIDKLGPLVEEDKNRDIPINSKFTLTAMRINDGIILSEAEREEKLIKLFADEGITLEFIN